MDMGNTNLNNAINLNLYIILTSGISFILELQRKVAGILTMLFV